MVLFRRILWWWEECSIIKTKYSERTRWGNNKYLSAATVSLCNNQIFFGKKKNILLKGNFHHTHTKTYRMIPLAFPMLQKVSFQAMHRIKAWVHDIMLIISSSMYVSKLCEMEHSTHLHFTTSNPKQNWAFLGFELHWEWTGLQCVLMLPCRIFGFAHFIFFLMAYRTHCVVAYSILQVFSL